MKKHIKTLLLALVALIGFSFTQDVSAKVCVYQHKSQTYVGSSVITGITQSIKVSYDDESICYYINGNMGDCFSGRGVQQNNGTDSTIYIENKIPLSQWTGDSDGCIDNLYLAYDQLDRAGGGNRSAYVFTTEVTDHEVYGVPIKPTPATFVESKDTITVTYTYPDGSTIKQEVKFGGTATNRDVVAGEGKNFRCWKELNRDGCFNFSTPIKHDTVLEATTTDQQYSAGFEQLGHNTTCNGVEIPYGLPYMISRIIRIIKILVPIILIVLGMIDYGKAVVSGKEDVMKKCSSAFVRRCIAAVLIFLTVALVQFGFGILGDTGNELFDCFDCFVNGNCASN